MTTTRYIRLATLCLDLKGAVHLNTYGHKEDYRKLASVACIPASVVLLFSILPSVKLFSIEGDLSFSAAKLSIFLLSSYLIFLLLFSKRIVVPLLTYILILTFILVQSVVAIWSFWVQEVGTLSSSEYMGSIVWYGVYPLLISTVIANSSITHKELRFWLGAIGTLCMLGYAQIGLYLLGINTSYESIGEPAFENVAVLGGIEILRANSIFGEPRDLAVVCLTISVLMMAVDPAYFRRQVPLLFLLALLTMSSTAILCVLGASFIWGISKLTRSVVFLLFASGSFFWIYADYELAEGFGRYSFVVDVFSNIATGKIPAFLNEQAVDLLVAPFVLSGEFLTPSYLFGRGLGGEHVALVHLHEQYAQAVEFPATVLSSRLIWYTFWLEAGLICFVALFVVAWCVSFKASRSALFSKEPRQLIILLMMAFWCSLQSTGYVVFFWFAVVGLILRNWNGSVRSKTNGALCS